MQFEITNEAATAFSQTFYSTLADEPSGPRIPPELVARSAIAAGAFASLLKPSEQLHFINRLADWGETYSGDDTIWNCVLALYNVVSVMNGQSIENAFRALEVICDFHAQRPDWSVNNCLGAAVRIIWMSNTTNVVERIRLLLEELLPTTIDPDYLARKEADWGIDLSMLKDSST